ncbi:MAG TPA: acetolactate synthase small subunit, partial [Anaerolineae bacterium]
DVTYLPTVMRDLALVKVRADASALAELNQLASIFRANIVDVSHDSAIIEVTGDEAKIDGLLDVLRPRGIIEMVRTGQVAMSRGNGHDNGYETDKRMNGNGNGHHAESVGSV